MFMPFYFCNSTLSATLEGRREKDTDKFKKKDGERDGGERRKGEGNGGEGRWEERGGGKEGGRPRWQRAASRNNGHFILPCDGQVTVISSMKA